MKTVRLSIMASLFFFMLADINAQVTNYGTNSGTGGEASSYFGIGSGAISTGANNTFLGDSSGVNNTIGSHNNFIGTEAGLFNTTGSQNVFNGYRAGYQNTTGTHNTFIGLAAGKNNVVGKYNAFLGNSAGYNNNASYNIFVGYSAGYDNTSGYANVFMGHVTGRYNTSGIQNTFIGNAAGLNNLSGSSNTIIGGGAGNKNTSGQNNVLVGSEAGRNVEGSGNICLGYRAGYNETGSNKLYIDNNYYAESDSLAADAPLIYGDFNTHQLGINTDSIPEDYMLAVKGRVIATEVRVKNSNNWPDYVFSNEYDLLPIEDLETFISKEQHLPDVPSAEEVVAQGGSDVGEMNKILLQKVEELTLYIIQLNKKIEAMEEK